MIPDGFTSDAELAWLRVQAAQHSAIVEIGCWIGRSTWALSKTPGFVLCVDDWAGDGHGFLPTDISDFSPFPNGGLDAFASNMADKMGKVIPLRMKSQDAADLFPIPCFDMVWIDGDHRYGWAREDIQKWTWTLKKGGLLCGHNYEECWKDDVMRVVDELVPDRQLVPGTSIWWKEL
jgi:hypothetical protein